MEAIKMNSGYTPPLALNIIGAIFLLLGAICALVVAGDILLRRGWRSMMWIMIPVYMINAIYMLPVTLWVYFKYGRAAAPLPRTPEDSGSKSGPGCYIVQSPPTKQNTGLSDDSAVSANSLKTTQETHICHASSGAPQQPQQNAAYHASNAEHRNACQDNSEAEKAEPAETVGSAGMPTHCHHHDSPRPMYATVLVGVSHCGAGCVLGDLVGEWLVYGTGVSIKGEMIWPALLIDYAFALLFGIIFQYFSIAPMSGEYGLKSFWRAAKADILSLTSFEIGALGWMVIYQVGIWNYRLDMTTWTYWWMMQVGMVLGFATAMPMNWWLISKGIKEPCA